ncbi:MAG: hypothetical protein M9891_01745 [Austwickia sp.]|nr:hypothetical protein [Actinomycetota bacterium]MCO5308017.1 hypothetical protein [Austwickia sp.]
MSGAAGSTPMDGREGAGPAAAPATSSRPGMDPAGLPTPGVTVVCGPDNDLVDASVGAGRVSRWAAGKAFVVYDAPSERPFPGGATQHIVDLVDVGSPCSGAEGTRQNVALSAATSSSGYDPTTLIVAGGLAAAGGVGLVLFVRSQRREEEEL